MSNDSISYLGKILEKEYHIPKYQRKFSWRRQQALELWTDLLEYYHSRDVDSKYIFGQIITYVAKSDDNKVITNYVIDGQQRITTSYLFLAASNTIVNLIYPDKNNIPEQAANFQYTNKISRLFCNKKCQYVPRLQVSKENADLFHKIISGGYRDIDENSSNNLVSVYSLFVKQIFLYLSNEDDIDESILLSSRVLENNYDAFEQLEKIVNCYLEFLVVDFSITKLGDAYRLFDTVNTRGIHLEFTDLVKNHIFSKCYSNDKDLIDDSMELEKDWDDVVCSVDDFPKFFRYVLIAKYGIVRDDEIMAVVKKKLCTPELIREFIRDLKLSAPVYLTLKGDYEKFTNHDSKRILRGIHAAKGSLTFHAPILISPYLRAKHDNLSDEVIESNMHSIIKALDCSFVRGLFVGKKSNDYEEGFAKIAEQYYNKNIELDAYVKSIRGFGYDDVQFKSLLTNKDWEPKDVKYLLSEIYNRKTPTLVIKDSVDLEHILPKNIKKTGYWGEFDIESHKMYHKKLGNLILLDKGANRGLGNKEFSIKVDKYKKIKEKNKILDIDAQDIIKMEVWTKESIDSRTKKLVDLIVSLWPLENVVKL